MKVEFTVSMGAFNKVSEVVEHDDGMTDEELDKEWSTWIMNSIDGYWEKIEE